MRIVTNSHMTGFRAKRFEHERVGAWVNLYLLDDGGRETDSLIELTSVDECDELIKAAVEAKRLLSPPDPGDCTCGHVVSDHIYARPGPCTQCECKAFDVAVMPDDTSAAWAAGDDEAAAILARAIETGMPVIVEDDAHIAAAIVGTDPWCQSKRHPMPGLIMLCELRAGHPGPHRAPGHDEGDPDITWTDETASAGAA